MRRLRCSGGGLLLATVIAVPHLAGAAMGPAAAPLLALWEHDSGVALESTSPRVVIYQDGTVIARRDPQRAGSPGADRGAGSDFVTRKLPMAELNVWFDDISALAQDEELKSRYDLDQQAGGPNATFFFQAGAHGMLVTVRGLSSGALSPFGALRQPAVEEVPARLLRIFQDARRLDPAAAVTWRPQHVEARFEPAEEAGAQPLPWPTNWRRPAGDGGRLEGTTLLLDSAEFFAAPDFSQVAAGRMPLVVEGAVVRVAFRFVLPGEESWRRRFMAESDANRASRAAMARAQLGAEREQVRGGLQDRAPAIPPPAPAAIEAPPPPTLELPPIDRAEPRLSPLPRTPDPPNPKSKKSR